MFFVPTKGVQALRGVRGVAKSAEKLTSGRGRPGLCRCRCSDNADALRLCSVGTRLFCGLFALAHSPSYGDSCAYLREGIVGLMTF